MAASPAQRGPRIVFVTAGRAGSRADRFAWRLDAANNRPLGRGVRTHASLEDCRQWLTALRRDAADTGAALLDAVSFDSTRGLWTWRLHRDGEVCATGGRTYLRRFECRRAVAHFRAALVETEPDVGVLRVVRPDVLRRYETGDGAAVA